MMHQDANQDDKVSCKYYYEKNEKLSFAKLGDLEGISWFGQMMKMMKWWKWNIQKADIWWLCVL